MGDVLVLCYHALSPDWPAALSTTPERFEEQLELLVRRRYGGTTFGRAVREPPSQRAFAVTFDDAYRSVFELALPIMRRLGIPGSVFVPTRYAGSPQPMSWEGIDQWAGGPHEKELLCMSWDQLGELAEHGWEIGSHTRSHPHLSKLDDERLTDELEGSRSDCAEGMGLPCDTVAYPYGDTDARVAAAARAAGYSAAAGLPDRRYGPRDPFDWPRVGVYNRDDLTRFRLKVARPMRMLRASRAWRSLSAGRA